MRQSRIITVIGILFLTPLLLNCQPIKADDLLLSQLRGEWEFHTFQKRWRLDFISDSELRHNGVVKRYTLNDGMLKVMDDEEFASTPVIFESRLLTLKSTDGTSFRFNHRSQGSAEQLLNGSFVTPPDSQNRKLSISFYERDNLSNFLLEFDHTAEHGIFRIEGNNLLMRYDDGSVDQATLRYDRNSETILSIAYGDEEFMKYVFSYGRVLATKIPPYYPGPDPPCFCGPPPPPYPPDPVPNVTQIPSSPSPAPVIRVIGSTRGSQR